MTPEYLAKLLTPFPLPTKDGWMLRTIGDTGAYILALPRSVMETILPTRQPAHRGLRNAVQRVGSPGAVTSWGPTADQRLARGAIAPRQHRGLFNHLVSAVS
jgi:hypothetical protein